MPIIRIGSTNACLAPFWPCCCCCCCLAAARARNSFNLFCFLSARLMLPSSLVAVAGEETWRAELTVEGAGADAEWRAVRSARRCFNRSTAARCSGVMFEAFSVTMNAGVNYNAKK